MTTHDRRNAAPASSMHAFERHESEVRSYIRAFPAVFERAAGSHLFDEQGREYIDFFSGAGALNYGHNHPEIKQSVLGYLAEDGITHSLDMATRAKRTFIERFYETVLWPRGLDYKFLFPGPTGTNAVEASLKLARKATGRENIFAFQGGFHGMTLGALAITSNPTKRNGAGHPLNHSRMLPFDGDRRDGLDSLAFLRRELRQAASRGEIPAAVVLETVQCEGGVRVASPEWLKGVEQACREHGVLVIVDDIQAGCGRTGTFFSFEESGMTPDLVCLSKSLSGLGIPLSLVLLRDELDVFRPGEHNGTFRGHNLAFVSATKALDFWVGPEFQSKLAKKATVLRERLKSIADSIPVAARVRGRGMIQGITFEDPDLAGAISSACFDLGVVIETAGHGDEVLKFLPALTMPDTTLQRGLDLIERCIRDVVSERVAEPAVA